MLRAIRPHPHEADGVVDLSCFPGSTTIVFTIQTSWMAPTTRHPNVRFGSALFRAQYRSIYIPPFYHPETQNSRNWLRLEWHWRMAGDYIGTCGTSAQWL